jgi:hypothetical protein
MPPGRGKVLIILFRNDGTGDKHIANYEVTVRVNSLELHRARIEGHRRSGGWRELVRMLLESEEGRE